MFAEFLDLALAHEQSEQPSLQGFLAAMRSRDVSIARELSERGAGVRVMTVHGAKGLEAPIVILADAASKPMGSQLRSAVYIAPERTCSSTHRKTDSHVAQTERYRTAYQQAQVEEYWRKLYVAMTRAEDELYVTGTLTKTGKLDGTWYEAIDEALRPEAEIVDGSDHLSARAPAGRTGRRHRRRSSKRLVRSTCRRLSRCHTARSRSSAHPPRRSPPTSSASTTPPPKPRTTPRPRASAASRSTPCCSTSAACRRPTGHRCRSRRSPTLAAGHPRAARRSRPQGDLDPPPEHRRHLRPDSRAEVPFLTTATRDGDPVLSPAASTGWWSHPSGCSSSTSNPMRVRSRHRTRRHRPT